MAAQNTWTVTDSNGQAHTIERKNKKITIDGAVYKAKSSNWFIQVIDYQVQFPGLNCNVVVIGNKADLAVNGTYLGSGKTYEPLGNIPAWLWLLVGVSVLGGWFCGGLILLAIGAGLSVLYIQNYLEKKSGKVWMWFGLWAVLAVIFLILQFTLLNVAA